MTGDEMDRAETRRLIRKIAATQDRTQAKLEHLSRLAVDLAEGQRRTRADIDALVKRVGGLIEGGGGETVGA